MDRFGFIFPLNQLHWWIGAALVVLALIAWGLFVLERRRHARLANFIGVDLAPRLLPGYDAKLRRPLLWLSLAGCVCMAIAFTQPHWGQSWQQIRQQSRDVIVCLDTSESMRATNPLPSRLERSKQKILSMIDAAPGDRFGLVAFSGASALECPLTHDHGYFKSVLSAVDTDTISMEGTDISAALREAVKVFKEQTTAASVQDRNTRAILLISDGEQVSGDVVAEAEAASEFAHVYVIGVGDPNGAEITLPEWMGRYVGTQETRKPHLSKLDEETLSKVAISGKGGYVRSTPDNSDIEQIYDHFKELTTYTAASDVRMRLVNRYQWFVGFAILCFGGEGLWLALMPWIRRWRMRRMPASIAAVDGWNSASEDSRHA